MFPPGVHQLTVPVNELDHTLGPLDAPLNLVEYGDYECPFCGAAHVVVKNLIDNLGDGLLFAFRNFPIASAHPHAVHAAEAAEAAGGQGRFWPMHDRLFEHQNALDDASLVRHAEVVGLDLKRFIADIEEHRYLPRIRADMAGGARSGVNGTPTFFVNGIRHDGGWDLESLSEALLAAQGQGLR